MKRLVVQVPSSLKAKLDALRHRGYTASGLIRHALEQYFSTKTHKGRRFDGL